MLKHCFEDRRPCCQINKRYHTSAVNTNGQCHSSGQIQDQQNTAKREEKKKKNLALYWTVTSWLCDPLNLKKSSLLQLCQRFPSDICHLQKTSRPSISCILHPGQQGQTGVEGWIGPCCRAQTRRTELSTACPGDGGANIDELPALFLPARMALWPLNSCPLTYRLQSVKRDCSHRFPRSSDSWHSGTFSMFMLDWPEMFTESWTTLTCRDSQSRANLDRGLQSSPTTGAKLFLMNTN